MSGRRSPSVLGAASAFEPKPGSSTCFPPAHPMVIAMSKKPKPHRPTTRWCQPKRKSCAGFLSSIPWKAWLWALSFACSMPRRFRPDPARRHGLHQRSGTCLGTRPMRGGPVTERPSLGHRRSGPTEFAGSEAPRPGWAQCIDHVHLRSGFRFLCLRWSAMKPSAWLRSA